MPSTKPQRTRRVALVLTLLLGLMPGIAAGGSNAQVAATGGGITGTVTSASDGAGRTVGDPIGDLCVAARREVDPELGLEDEATTFSAADGTYVFDALPPDDYVVAFTDCREQAAYFPASSDAVVADGVVTSGVDAALALGATISGTITGEDTGSPFADACASALYNSGATGSRARANGSGEYWFGPLEPDDYTISFHECGDRPFYLREWWDDQPTAAEADTVTIVGAEQVTGIDAALTPGEDRLVRIGGADRVDTAVQLSQDLFPHDASTTAVVLARSDDFADALGGVPLAARVGGPLLVSPSSAANDAGGHPDRIDPRVQAEIRRLLGSTGRIYVLGGTAAFSDAALDELRPEASFEITRLAGHDRFETATAIAYEIGLGSNFIFITTGLDFPDALAAGAAAADAGGTVVLSAGAAPHPATDEYLADNDSATTVVTVGGPAAAAYPQFESLVGDDRFHTAALIADRYFVADGHEVGLAVMHDYPDALGGGAHIGALGGPILLTAGASLDAGLGGVANPHTRRWLEANAARMGTVYVYGGEAAITPATASAALEAIG